VNREQLLTRAVKASVLAGESIRVIYESPSIEVSLKSDTSPLTAADLASHESIIKSLKGTSLPVLSEEQENAPYSERRDWGCYWLIDPLDGTKEFLSRNGEFTVNIALIENGLPTLGVVYAPALGELFYADLEQGSFQINDVTSSSTAIEQLMSSATKLEASEPSSVLCRVIGSRSHISPEFGDFVDRLKGSYASVEVISAGSSLKFCRVAQGAADIYPRLGRTMEWDTAAGHVVAKAAGRSVLEFNKNVELSYNKEDLANPWFVVS
jgi:3'(2'), 5'-bisphosphate nucleotidase